jgi:glycosyltransferase involved in cell wall biosynthesis
MLPKKTTIITNMDGIEWKRSKYSVNVRKFLKYAEKLAVKSSRQLVADSEAIKDYLDEKYKVNSVFIPYGAEVFSNPNPSSLNQYDLNPEEFFLLIARMQPDNHVEEIIKGVLDSETKFPLVVVGNMKNKFGEYLIRKYTSDQIRFVGGIFDKTLLNQLRFFSKIYFHGHSAGGTNPSLLEAMAASALICAHDNPFNQSVLGADASYFQTEVEITKLINMGFTKSMEMQWIVNNLEKIKNKYSWDKIIQSYFNLFQNCRK